MYGLHIITNEYPDYSAQDHFFGIGRLSAHFFRVSCSLLKLVSIRVGFHSSPLDVRTLCGIKNVGLCKQWRHWRDGVNGSRRNGADR